MDQNKWPILDHIDVSPICLVILRALILLEETIAVTYRRRGVDK